MINDGVGGELPPEASTMLQAVERNTAELSQLIENISALSSTEADATEHGPVDIVHLVSELTARRASNANQAVPGAGVGLSIAKRTFEAHHGSITIESSLGVGTIVAITLPLLNHAAVG